MPLLDGCQFLPVHAHEALVREFYARFAARDAEGMAACYHPDIAFSDPVFPMLRGDEAGDMWRMLLSRAADLEVTLWTDRWEQRSQVIVQVSGVGAPG